MYSSDDIYEELKGLEQDWLILKDQYSELVRAIGIEGDTWFGDPLISHEEILKEAKEIKELAEMYKGLCK